MWRDAQLDVLPIINNVPWQVKARGKAAVGAAAPRLHEELLAERVDADTPPADRLDAEVLHWVRCCVATWATGSDVVKADSNQGWSRSTRKTSHESSSKPAGENTAPEICQEQAYVHTTLRTLSRRSS